MNLEATGGAPRAQVVINGDDIYEELFPVGDQLRQIASRVGYATTLNSGMARFSSWAPKGPKLNLVVLYTGMGQFTPEQQTGLAELVEEGCGLLVVHGSNVLGMLDGGELDPSYETAFELFGSRFVSHGPEPHWTTFEVHFDQDHPITRGMAPFSIYTERNHHEFSEPRPRMLGWRISDEGAHPLLTAHERGGGRVVFFHPGHDKIVIGQPGVQEVLERAMKWAGRIGEEGSGGASAEQTELEESN